MKPTRTGWIVLIAAVTLLVPGIVADYPELVALGLSATALVAFAWARVLTRPRIRAQRSITPSRVPEGEPITCELEVWNESGRTSPEFELTELVADRPQRFHLGRLVAHGYLRYEYEIATQSRGVYVLPPPSIDRLDPARLVRRVQHIGPAERYFVHPRHQGLALFGAGGLRDIDGEATSAQRDGVAFYSLREYVPGDDRRLIHWPSTARMGQLMVRHNTMPDESGYLVVLDTLAGRYMEVSFEEAVRVAASFCVAAVRSGASLWLTTTDGQIPPDSHGTLGATEMDALDFLAGVGRGRHDVSWKQALAREDPVAGVVVVTGRLDADELAALTGTAVETRTTAVIQLHDDHAASISAPSANVISFVAPSSAEFVEQWNGRPQ
ncbi:DUF58 domain-containing protein [Lentzea sp. NPDC006480]|uniref:DUF58 domain-containing protein n=1 Tax=Lentzea sp. NPDC006480 TaxID=3157176 RepID=UPI0033AC05E7